MRSCTWSHPLRLRLCEMHSLLVVLLLHLLQVDAELLADGRAESAEQLLEAGLLLGSASARPPRTHPPARPPSVVRRPVPHGQLCSYRGMLRHLLGFVRMISKEILLLVLLMLYRVLRTVYRAIQCVSIT